MILIAGGTGWLGRQIVGRLTAAGEGIRVVTRDPRRAAEQPVQVITGDICDPATAASAARGCSTVISAIHGLTGGRHNGPAEVDRDANRTLIEVAGEAGVDHFMLISVLGAAPDHPMSLHRMKYAAEERLRASALTATILRPSAYLETWIEVLGARLSRGGPALVFGNGHNPITFVSPPTWPASSNFP
jgi:uncharacterized protein YbjT (DUF2867 family)